MTLRIQARRCLPPRQGHHAIEALLRVKISGKDNSPCKEDLPSFAPDALCQDQRNNCTVNEESDRTPLCRAAAKVSLDKPPRGGN